MFLRTGSFPAGELTLPNVLTPVPGAVTDSVSNRRVSIALWTRHACAHPWVTVASVGDVGGGWALLGQPAEKPKHGAPAGGSLSSLSSPTCLSPAQHTPANPLTLLLCLPYTAVTYK